MKGNCLGLLLVTALAAAPAALIAAEQPGTVSLPSNKPFAALAADLEKAVRDHGMGVVTKASASKGAAARGVQIPGNMVIGVFRNDFAVRMLEVSTPAGIEAPLRYYLTENADGTTTLTYRRPTAVFAPYDDDRLDQLAAELDAIYQQIADDAVR